MAITLAELVYSELIGLVQRTRVSYPACFNKIRLTENMVDKRESYTKEDLLASGRGELFGAKGPQLPAPNMLMMDRVVKMTETGGNFDKGYVEAELDINPRSVVLRMPLYWRSGYAGMPGPGRNVAAGRVLPRLAGRRR